MLNVHLINIVWCKNNNFKWSLWK